MKFPCALTIPFFGIVMTGLALAADKPVYPVVASCQASQLTLLGFKATLTDHDRRVFPEWLSWMSISRTKTHVEVMVGNLEDHPFMHFDLFEITGDTLRYLGRTTLTKLGFDGWSTIPIDGSVSNNFLLVPVDQSAPPFLTVAN